MQRAFCLASHMQIRWAIRRGAVIPIRKKIIRSHAPNSLQPLQNKIDFFEFQKQHTSRAEENQNINRGKDKLCPAGRFSSPAFDITRRQSSRAHTSAKPELDRHPRNAHAAKPESHRNRQNKTNRFPQVCPECLFFLHRCRVVMNCA
ncbi:MAG: hypothetical protein RBS08_04510 [Bdellovibrionales bacterium]|nr:hypothetical protein [Bdellovibrionales bacterium]